MEQGSEPVGREEPTAAGMDVDGTAIPMFKKVEDDADDHDADAKSDLTDSNMQDLMEDSSDGEVKDWKEAMDSDDDSESDTEDGFEQQWALGECLYSATMLDDS